MKVIIPLAGKGSRMRPHTHTKAKPLLPVAGKPVLEHVFDSLKGIDVSEYIFITGHLKEQIEEYITTHHDFTARFIEQAVKDGTAGAIKLAEEFVDEPILIVFVDTIFDADLSIIKDAKDGIIWAKEVEDYQRFGVIVQEDGFMQRIVEKPSEPISKLANIGVYYIKNYQQLFEGIHHVYEKKITLNGEYFLTDAFQYMIDNGAQISVAEVTGWYDCGKPETTLETNATLLKKYHEVNSELTKTEIIEPVFIEEGCTIENCVIGPNVSIAKNCTVKNARLHDCIVDQGSTILDMHLAESILGVETFIEGEGQVKASVMLGDHARSTFK